MAEGEWLAATKPEPLVDFLNNKASHRKLRLFAVACCRRIWPLIAASSCRHAVEVAERYADGEASDRELRDIERQLDESLQGDSSQGGHARTMTIACHKTAWDPFRYTVLAQGPAFQVKFVTLGSRLAIQHVGFETTPADEQFQSQVRLLHDIFGRLPFRPVTIDASWLTSTVLAFAQAIYDDRAFERMPILADALEDAGCTNADILSHCRQPGGHVRGCWVVDLLLGRN